MRLTWRNTVITTMILCMFTVHSWKNFLLTGWSWRPSRRRLLWVLWVRSWRLGPGHRTEDSSAQSVALASPPSIGCSSIFGSMLLQQSPYTAPVASPSKWRRTATPIWWGPSTASAWFVTVCFPKGVLYINKWLPYLLPLKKLMRIW